MKTSSVALFLALSAGYLGVANAESLTSNVANAGKAALSSSNEKLLDSNKTSRTTVVTKKPDSR